MKIVRCLLVFLVLVFLGITNLFAEENPFFVKFKTRFMLAADAQDQSGDIQLTKIKLRLGYQKELENGRPFYVTIGPDHYIADDSTAANIPDEFKSRGIRIGTEFDMPLVADDRYSWGWELNPTFQSAKKQSFDGETFRFNFSTFGKFKGDNDLVWVLGANVRPEYDLVVLPIFGVNYKLNDKISLNLVSDEPNIAYLLNDDTKILLEFDYTLDEFEVTDDTNKGAILQMQDFATGVGVEHSFNNNFLASVGVGGVFNRILKFQNETGKAVLDDGLYLNVKMDARF